MSPVKSGGDLIPVESLIQQFPDLFNFSLEGEIEGANDIPAIATLPADQENLLKSAEIGIGKVRKAEILDGFLMLIIKEQKLYRKFADTWEDYVERRWGIQSRRSYDRTQAAEVYLTLRSAGFEELPKNMSQCLIMHSLEPEARVEVWQMVLDEGRKPTSDLIAQKARHFRSFQTALPGRQMVYQGDPITWVSEDGEKVILSRGDRVIPAGVDSSSTTQTLVRLPHKPQSVYQVLVRDLTNPEEEVATAPYNPPASAPRLEPEQDYSEDYSRPTERPIPRPRDNEEEIPAPAPQPPKEHEFSVGDRVILANPDANVSGLKQGEIGKIEALKGSSASVVFGKRSVLCPLKWLEWCPPIEPGDVFRLVDLMGPNGQHNGFRAKFLEFNKEGTLRMEVLRSSVSPVYLPVRIHNLAPVKETEIHRIARSALGNNVEIVESRAEARIARKAAQLFVNAVADPTLAQDAITKFRAGELEELMVLMPSQTPKAMFKHLGLVAAIAYIPEAEAMGSLQPLFYFGTDAGEFVAQVEAEFQCPVFTPFNPAIEVDSRSA